MKAICFDFDDVIVQENLGIHIIEMFSNDIPEEKIISEMMESSERSVKTLVMIGKGLNYEVLKDMIRKFKITPEIEKMLAELKKRGHKLFIVSINDSGLIRLVLEENKLMKYFDGIYGAKLGMKNDVLTGVITGDVVEKGKDSAIAAIEKKFKIKRKDVVYIGDGLTDMQVMKLMPKCFLYKPKPKVLEYVKKDPELKKMIEQSALTVVDGKITDILGHID